MNPIETINVPMYSPSANTEGPLIKSLVDIPESIQILKPILSIKE